MLIPMSINDKPVRLEKSRDESQTEQINMPKRDFKELLTTQAIDQDKPKARPRDNYTHTTSKKDRKPKSAPKTSIFDISAETAPVASLLDCLEATDGTSSLTGLSLTDIEEICELLSTEITTMAKDGIELTEMVIQTQNPNSALNGLEVSIKLYDTNPMTFHIEILGDTAALNLFNPQRDSLLSQLQQRLPSFKFQLETHHSPLKKRKKHAHIAATKHAR